MMDLSDGLAKDLLALMPPQGSPALAEGALPLRRGATVANALSDGEDYELLFTLAPTTDHVAFQRRWARRFPRLRLTRIGRIVRPNAMPETALNLAEYHGYEHLR
jgi:thiamine-monophosphate kinase